MAQLKVEVHQQLLTVQLCGVDISFADIKIANHRKLPHIKSSMASEGQASTGTLLWAVIVTVPLVVLLRTLGQSVTHVIGVETGLHSPTPVETRTRVLITPLLILTALAVVDPVTSHKHWHTVAFVEALEVAVRTLGCIQKSGALVVPGVSTGVMLVYGQYGRKAGPHGKGDHGGGLDHKLP